MKRGMRPQQCGFHLDIDRRFFRSMRRNLSPYPSSRLNSMLLNNECTPKPDGDGIGIG